MHLYRNPVVLAREAMCSDPGPYKVVGFMAINQPPVTLAPFQTCNDVMISWGPAGSWKI